MRKAGPKYCHDKYRHVDAQVRKRRDCPGFDFFSVIVTSSEVRWKTTLSGKLAVFKLIIWTSLNLIARHFFICGFHYTEG